MPSGFCCDGCAAVYRILHEKGLDHFYELRAHSFKKNSRPPFLKGDPVNEYLWWNSASFRESYLKHVSETSICELTLYLEGIHCLGCLWLIEALPQWKPGVIFSRLDLGTSIVHLTVKPDLNFASLAQDLAACGYRPHPVASPEEANSAQLTNERHELIRLGVAAACAGNIMLLSIPLYAGATGSAVQFFRWSLGVLFVPVVTYCLFPMASNAWQGLRRFTLSIDLPIALAVILAACASYANLMNGRDAVYFDSLSALVFLLLGSRHLLRRAQRKAFSAETTLTFLSTPQARRIKDGKVEAVGSESLFPGDILEVRTTDMFPADGFLKSAETEVDNSLLTGESLPQKRVMGEAVYAGTRNCGQTVRIEVTAVGNASRVGQIVERVKQEVAKRAPIVQFADKTAKVFLSVIILLALGVFLFRAGGSYSIAFSRALALLVVSCPCAFALAVPLSLTLSLRRALSLGIIIKDFSAIETMAKCRQVFLDKTGTLTYGRLSLIHVSPLPMTHETENIICALEERSQHPIARALIRGLNPIGARVLPKVSDWIERPGAGVEGRVDGVLYKMRGLDSSSLGPKDRASVTCVGLYQEEKQLATVELIDQWREDSKSAVDSLKELGCEPWLLSGDDPGVVRDVALAHDIAKEHALGRLTPEAKRDWVKSVSGSIMVGDGANDAVALAASDVGIAVHGSMEVCLRAAPVFLSVPGVGPVVESIRLARRTMKTIYAALGFSVVYNAAGISLALSGKITPLIAAILMPVSSLSVIALAWYSLRPTRIKEKEVA